MCYFRPIYIHIYVYIYVYMCIYIYVYIERERGEGDPLYTRTLMYMVCVYIHTHIYTHTHIHTINLNVRICKWVCLRRADLSSREVLPTVECHCFWSRNFKEPKQPWPALGCGAREGGRGSVMGYTIPNTTINILLKFALKIYIYIWNVPSSHTVLRYIPHIDI
jgi:hypothetical protein